MYLKLSPTKLKGWELLENTIIEANKIPSNVSPKIKPEAKEIPFCSLASISAAFLPRIFNLTK